MAQHDMVLDNNPGLAFRSDANAAILALVENSSGPVEPVVMYPGMFWLDTSIIPNGQLRQRNLANTAWVDPTLTPTGLAPFVRIDAVQAFTAAQKMQGRVNIGAVGNLFKRTVYSVGATHTYDPETKFAYVEVVGGGGSGGGGAAGTTGTCMAGAGGGAGGYVSKFFSTTGIVSGIVTVGAGGAATAAAGNNGNTSSYVDSANSLSATGGGGGTTPGNVSSIATVIGGAGGIGSGGDLNFVGATGDTSISLGSALGATMRLARGGRGGDSVFGGAGQGYPSASSVGAGVFGNGAPGQCPGAGGGGGSAVNTNGTGAGGAGANGIVIIWEFK